MALGSASACRPHGEVRRVSDQASQARFALADQLADHDETGRDADF